MDRDAEEGTHRRVIGRKAHGARVLAEVVKPERRVLADEDSEDPPPARKVADRSVRVGINARGEEALELGTASVDHAERGVASGRELGSRLDQALQEGVERQLGRERDPGLDERPQALFAQRLGVHWFEAYPASISTSYGPMVS